MKLNFRPITLINEIMAYTPATINAALEDIHKRSFNVTNRNNIFGYLVKLKEEELEKIVEVIHSDNWYDEKWDK